jgi:hypothetical protein
VVRLVIEPAVIEPAAQCVTRLGSDLLYPLVDIPEKVDPILHHPDRDPIPVL